MPYETCIDRLEHLEYDRGYRNVPMRYRIRIYGKHTNQASFQAMYYGMPMKKHVVRAQAQGVCKKLSADETAVDISISSIANEVSLQVIILLLFGLWIVAAWPTHLLLFSLVVVFL